MKRSALSLQIQFVSYRTRAPPTRLSQPQLSRGETTTFIFHFLEENQE